MITTTTVATVELRGDSEDVLTVEFQPNAPCGEVVLQLQVQDKRLEGEFTVHEVRQLVAALLAAGFGREEDTGGCSECLKRSCTC